MSGIRESVEVWILRRSRDGMRVLLLHKPPRSTGERPHGGFWQAVTGGIEAGESATDAAVREVHEETGLRIAEPDLVVVLPMIELPLDQGPLLRRRVFASWVEHEEVALSEHDSARWVQPADVLPALHWPSGRIAWAALIESRILDTAGDDGAGDDAAAGD